MRVHHADVGVVAFVAGLRAQASFTSGTLVVAGVSIAVVAAVIRVLGQGAGINVLRGVPTGDAHFCGGAVQVHGGGDRRTLGTRVENRRMRGIGLGRPPTSPDRPGAMPVAAWGDFPGEQAQRLACRHAGRRFSPPLRELSSRRAWAP